MPLDTQGPGQLPPEVPAEPKSDSLAYGCIYTHALSRPLHRHRGFPWCGDKRGPAAPP